MVKELKDYRGPFIPNLKFADLSKEMLLKLLDAYWNLAMGIAQSYQKVVAAKFGEDAAHECGIAMWIDLGPKEARHMRKALGLGADDNDVAAIFKAMQLDIAFPQSWFDQTWDLKSPDHGILTVTRCEPYEFFRQKLGEEYANKKLCGDLELRTFVPYASIFNPKMKCKNLKIPPRAPGEPYCQWEYTLEK